MMSNSELDEKQTMNKKSYVKTVIKTDDLHCTLPAGPESQQAWGFSVVWGGGPWWQETWFCSSEVPEEHSEGLRKVTTQNNSTEHNSTGRSLKDNSVEEFHL